jgi:thymidine kinase
MSVISRDEDTFRFLKSLGFPELSVHHAFNHFDFTRPGRRILVIGPMGSGKTEYSSRVWRDAQVASKKTGSVVERTVTQNADRRKVFFIRSMLDAQRFPEYPSDALAYRGGYLRCGDQIAKIRNSFELEEVIEDNPNAGTWIIDEASFYDERLVYVVQRASESRGLVFVFPSLVLNFRKDIFNATARLLLESATDVFPLTAYCEHESCIEDSFYTYRYYVVDGKECPALYFDPLIIIGGDEQQVDPHTPNYCTRCDEHHYLPGKEYTFFTLKPLGEAAAAGETAPLCRELDALHSRIEDSSLYEMLSRKYADEETEGVNMNSLLIPSIAERALMYLYAEANLLTGDQLRNLVRELDLDIEYIARTLGDNRRPLIFSG